MRSFLRNKAISLIHVLGLSLGISASLVIFLIVQFESGFDKFEKDGNRIYRVVMDLDMNGMKGHSAAVPAPLANAMAEVTGVDGVVPVMTFQGDAKVTVTFPANSSRKAFKEQEGTVFTTGEYFDLLPFNWIVGSPRLSLEHPFSVVLTESRAKLYFPGMTMDAVVGQQLNYNGDVTATITGIVQDLHELTDFQATDFLSYSTIAKTALNGNFMMDNWNDWMAYSSLYVKLSESNDRAGASAQINAIAERFRAKDNNKLTYVLQPLSDIHFNAEYASFNLRLASKSTLRGLTLLAGFLLVLACINFTNLASAQTSLRAREIGVRKSIGSSRKQLIFQFLIETFLVTLLASIVSMALAPVLLDLFKDFISNGVVFQPWSQPGLLGFLLALMLAVTLFAGAYPALVLSGLRPVAIFKGNVLPVKSGSTSLRKVLTVTQFMIAQDFIFGAFMVSKQVRYSLNEDLGFKKEAIVYFEVSRTGKDNREPLMNEIRRLPGVSKATIGFLPPASEGAAFGDIIFKKGAEEIKENVQLRWGAPQYIDVYGIDIIAGRNIREGKDIHEMLINETYAKAIGFTDPQTAINAEILNRETPYTIVGVMRDFHASSTHAPIGPIVFFDNDRNFFFHVALSPDRRGWSSTIDELRVTVAKLYPDQDFKYTFFDEAIAKFYEEEQNTAMLLNWAMSVSMLISCMGLLGLVMHTSETRTKEVGIRKVLGASVSNLVSILSVDFIKLVAIAFALAAPISWWATHRWLEGFAYRTAISWWVFIVSGLTMIVVALLALSFHTFKTARANPINSLRAD
jgi:ABC-type antimicrobial peptide transport system permease subunit